MRYYVTFPGGSEVPVDLDHLPNGDLSVTVRGQKLAADMLAQGGSTVVRLDGHVVDLWMEGAPPGVGVVARGKRFYATVESERMRTQRTALGQKGSATGEGTVVSPMPGRVLKVLVQEGDEIARGAPLVVVEAMKMENELVAERDGRVKKIFVSPGQTVESGARLVEIGEP
jgi:biotin carboxyl carrier protein